MKPSLSAAPLGTLDFKHTVKKLFCISYSNTRVQKLLVMKLVERLQALGAAEFAEIWLDLEIPSGAAWEAEIHQKFAEAVGYFVLGSSEYETSDYCKTEWAIIERRVSARQAQLFWIPMDRPAGGFNSVVELSRYQPAAGQRLPLFEVKDKERHECIAKVAEEIMEFLIAVENVRANQNRPRPSTSRQIEGAYLDALRAQCDSLHNRDRYLPMERLYVRLKADERPSSELKASEELVNKNIQTEMLESRNGNSDASASEIIEDHLKRMSETKSLPIEASRHYEVDLLDSIFQRNRFLVVRGAPGSGKTVLCWKIALTLSEAWRQEFEYRESKLERKLTDFGPARLPILIPIRDYARELRSCNGELPLANYLGRHFSKEVRTPLMEQFGEFLLEQIKHGRVVLLLDGLDEVPALERHRIVELIEAFLRTYMLPTLSGVEGNPGSVGGNQLLITSRLAGYELAPITESVFRHFIIRPFDEQAIEDYCRHWAKIRFGTRSANFGALGDLLVQSILRASSPTIRELARNPLLLQVLCELTAPLDVERNAETEEGLKALPRSRAEIYQQAIRVMAKRWEVAYEATAEKNVHLKILLEPGKMEVLLAHVALEMHRNEVLGRTTGEKLSQWLSGGVRECLELAMERLEGRPVYHLPPEEVSRTISSLMELISTHLGVISQTAPGVFAFHHLTFQEYLAGKAMCLRDDGKGWRSPDLLGREIAKRLPDARWREPALLAFGDLGLALRQDPSAPNPEAILTAIRRSWRENDSELTPEEAALLVAALVQELPDEIVGGLCESAIRELAACYRDWSGTDRSGSMVEPFVHALTLLRRRSIGLFGEGSANPFDQAAARIIKSDDTLAAPLARLCVDRVWLEPILVESFALARRQDSAKWKWPMHEGLRRTLIDAKLLLGHDWDPQCIEIFAPPDALAGMQDRINYDRTVDVWRERRQTEMERTARPALVAVPKMRAVLRPGIERLRTDFPALMRIIIAQCGGFKDYQCARWGVEYAEIAHFLQQPDSIRTGIINDAPEEFLPRWGVGDTVYNMAVYLDKKQEGRLGFANIDPRFEVDAIYHDPASPMLRLIERMLVDSGINHPPLTDLLARLAVDGRNLEMAAEAQVAMLATGCTLPENIDPAIRKATAWECGRVCDDLRDAVVRYSTKRKQPTTDKPPTPGTSEDVLPVSDDLWTLLDKFLPTLPEQEAMETFRLAMKTVVAAAGMPVKPLLLWQPERGSPLDQAVRGEIWAFGFAARTDDFVYHFDVLLNAQKFADDPLRVNQELQAIVGAENSRHFPGAYDFVDAHLPGPSYQVAISRFCGVLQFLCDAAGAHKMLFRERFFSLVTSGILKRPGPHPFPLLLLGDYCGAKGSDEIPVGSEVSHEMQSDLESSSDLDLPVSDDWKIGLVSDRLTHSLNIGTSRTSKDNLTLALGLCGDDTISQTDGWKAFTIFTVCHGYQESGGSTAFEEDLWNRLRTDMQSKVESVAETLTALTARAGAGGLGLTRSAARTIEFLAQTHSAEAENALKCLLPLVAQASPEEVPRLRRWASSDGLSDITRDLACLLSQHAALILAEQSSGLEHGWIRSLVDLSRSGDDRSKARVTQVLTSPISSMRRGIRRRHLSPLGLATAKEMVLSYLSTLDDSESCLRPGLCLDDLHFDNPAIVPELAALNMPGSPGVSVLVYILGCGTWTTETLDVVAQWLSADPARWHDAFVVSFGQLLYHQGVEVPATLSVVVQRAVASREMILHILPEESSYSSILSACLETYDQKPVGAATIKAAALLRATCETRLNAASTTEEIRACCANMGETNLQLPGTFPEDCWQNILSEIDNERLFELVVGWLTSELLSWSKLRRSGVHLSKPEDVYSTRVRNALLSILCVMTERWRDKFALFISNPQPGAGDLQELLTEAAIHHGMSRSRMAAITLLSRIPSLNADVVAELFRRAVAAEPSVRDRAVMLLPHFREFVATPAFLKSAISTLEGDAPASVVLAYAHLLARLLSENKVADYQARRKIINALHSAAKANRNIRLLSHLAGSGKDDDPRHVVNDGRLDEKLLALVASSYSGSVRN